MDKEFKPIPRFIPESCKGCKGHGIYMLDCDYTKKEDRDLLNKVLDDYINDYDRSDKPK